MSGSIVCKCPPKVDGYYSFNGILDELFYEWLIIMFTKEKTLLLLVCCIYMLICRIRNTSLAIL